MVAPSLSEWTTPEMVRGLGGAVIMMGMMDHPSHLHEEWMGTRQEGTNGVRVRVHEGRVSL